MDYDEFLCSEFFEHAALKLWRRQGSSHSSIIFSRRFRAYFGTSSKVCCFLWVMVKESVPVHCQPVYLLWALMFLKTYSTENVNASIALVDEKTFRKWCWVIIKEPSRLDLVSILLYPDLLLTT